VVDSVEVEEVASEVVEVVEVEPPVVVDSAEVEEEVASEVVEAAVLPVADEVLPEVGVPPVVLEVSSKQVASSQIHVAEPQTMTYRRTRWCCRTRWSRKEGWCIRHP
jgi:hypothetical protein